MAAQRGHLTARGVVQHLGHEPVAAVPGDVYKRQVFDYIQLTDGHSIYEASVPREWVGRTVVDLQVRQRWRINILAVKNPDGILSPLPGADHVFQSGERILILGSNEDIEKFLHL